MTPTTAQDAEALAAPQAPAHRRRRHLLSGSLLVLTLGALTLLAAWQAASMSERIARDAIAATATERARLYESSIHGALTRFDYIPDMVARYPRVRALLTRTGAARPVNVLLEELAQRSGADVLYVLDRTGMTVASSNWRDAFSFVGKNYGFRPYFRDALAGGRGRFFAVGVTTGRAGLFFSEAVRVDGEIVGVSVVKLETRTLQNDWRAGGENVLVTDADGVVILASRDDWLYRTLAPLPRDALARIEENQKYSGKQLRPLDMDLLAGNDVAVAIDGEPHLIASLASGPDGWTIHYAAPLSAARDRAFATGALVMLIGASILVVALGVRDRRLRAAAAAERAESEAMRRINAQLESEIAERRRTEEELKQTQAELIQSGKLAALGRMSAAIAHELNQPLSAMRTFISSNRVLLERGEKEAAEENLERLADLNERMAKITGQLKIFARRGGTRHTAIDVQRCIRNALMLLEPRIGECGAKVQVHHDGARVTALADTVRLEQVVTNLIANALDAVCNRDDGRVDIALEASGGRIRLAIADNGEGIAAQDAERLFDPFFTTKEVGSGLGLGLSISYGIIADLGGAISARNNDDGGATFTVELPLYDGPAQA